MISFKNIRPCTDNELIDVISYLITTPARSLAETKDYYDWFTFDLETPEELYELKTAWGKLKGVYKNIENPHEKFSLDEVAEMVRENNLPDKEIENDIKKYIKLLRANKLEIRLTLVQGKNCIIIVDGNKRAAAILLNGRKIIIKTTLLRLKNYWHT